MTQLKAIHIFIGILVMVMGARWLFLGMAQGQEVLETTHETQFTQQSDQENAIQAPLVIHFFEDRLCPVCKDQKVFMQELIEKYPHVELRVYPISDTESLHALAESHGIEDYRIMAPTTFIGENLFQFIDFGSQQEQILVAAIEGDDVQEQSGVLRVPLLNMEISPGDWSLPILAIVLGSIDGFNVCSLGTLILILSIVIKFDSRKKTFLYGGIFILSAGLIYGTLVFVWGKLFEAFIGQLEILRIIVGLAALSGGLLFFRDFIKFVRFGPACETGDSQLKSKATNRVIRALKDPTTKPLLLISSIILFAGVITLVELPCSIGLPIAFTGILVEQSVSLTAYTLYILLYMLFYMLDELIVLTGAVITKKLWFAGSRMITFITLAGALVLFYLAYYYLIGH